MKDSILKTAIASRRDKNDDGEIGKELGRPAETLAEHDSQSTI
jgi:hypothetical protein